MTTMLLIVIVAAALVCPLYMLWAMSRGRRPVCCAPAKASQIEALHERQRLLAAQLASVGSPGEPAQRPRDAR